MLRNKQFFEELALKDPYWKGRWDLYIKNVIQILKELQRTKNISDILEIGSNGVTFFENSDTLDITGVPTYYVDLSSQAIPAEKKSYDLVIATQVWEHLGTSQQKAWQEVRRVSKRALLSFPYMWNGDPLTDSHAQISRKIIDSWTDEYYSHELIVGTEKRQRLIRYWEF